MDALNVKRSAADTYPRATGEIDKIIEVIAGLVAKLNTNLLRAVTLSQRIGFLLYAIADEPTWVFSNGSSTCFRLADSRMSLHNLWAD